MYSQINQSIALKTVKKFGFSVNAVWNGQQALDYLLKEPSPEHPKPDIILMDVQMPILDGYRATHRIRHHRPYATMERIRSIPIVAMTASAIQGDREKCQKAGMDDYLAKPVKAPTLEKKLIKWAIEGQRPRRLAMTEDVHDDNDSNCGHHSEPSTDTMPLGSKSPSTSESTQLVAEASRLQGLDKSEGDRDLQRAEAEEKATELRDDKLLAASEVHPSITPGATVVHPPQKSPAVRPGLPPSKLTEENITRLDREQTPISLHVPRLKYDDSREASSMEVAGRGTLPSASTVGSFKSQKIQRGPLEKGPPRYDSDISQVTITPDNEEEQG